MKKIDKLLVCRNIIEEVADNCGNLLRCAIK